MTTRPDSRNVRAGDPAQDSPQKIAKPAARSNGNSHSSLHPAGNKITSEFLSDRSSQRRAAPMQIRQTAGRPLRVMKFGGTSIGDASCVSKVIDIIESASLYSDPVVVVSAMAGVTDRLIDAALQSEAGNHSAAAAILAELQKKHDLEAEKLLTSSSGLDYLRQKTDAILKEGNELCRRASLAPTLTLQTRDAITSYGERLSAALLATALRERGTLSEAIEATEVLVTNSCFGNAEPLMNITRERCEARIRPALEKGIIPVITGFIGATADGELTTLGRGGSDFSATILGAALHADEVTIWTDVNGVLTSDPRLVPGACTVPEISYHEAEELARFGAKVLHPKTLRPLMHTNIPLWIRNTFAPEKPGTKVTAEGSSNDVGVKALAVFNDAALIKLGGRAIAAFPNVFSRTFKAIAAVQADLLLVLHSSSQNDVRFVVPSARAADMIEILRCEFSRNLSDEMSEHIALDATVGVMSVVGQNMRHVAAIVESTFTALKSENVNIIAIAQGFSDCNVSFIVEQKDLQTALISTHRELRLGATDSEELTTESL